MAKGIRGIVRKAVFRRGNARLPSTCGRGVIPGPRCVPRPGRQAGLEGIDEHEGGGPEFIRAEGMLQGGEPVLGWAHRDVTRLAGKKTEARARCRGVSRTDGFTFMSSTPDGAWPGQGEPGEVRLPFGSLRNPANDQGQRGLARSSNVGGADNGADRGCRQPPTRGSAGVTPGGEPPDPLGRRQQCRGRAQHCAGPKAGAASS